MENIETLIAKTLGTIPNEFWWVLSLFSVILIIFMPLYLRKLPEDYFIRLESQRSNSLVSFLKNFLALVFLSSGFLMLFLPGQGLLTIFAALCIGEYPGKIRLIKKMTRSNKVRKVLNSYRRRANAKPFLWESTAD